MIIEKTTGLGECVLSNPKNYKGFMGVSIYNYFFTKKVMESYILWASEHFDEFLVVLMDVPERHNISVFKGIDKDAALAKSKKHAESLMVCFEKIIERNNLENVKVIGFRDFAQDDNYLGKKEIIDGGFLEDSEFREDVLSLMNLWIGDKIKEKFGEANEDVMNNLSNYIREELACLVYLTEKGYRIELDPTPEFTTKKRIYEGGFWDIGKKLGVSDRGHIYLHPEGVEKYGAKKLREIEALERKKS